MAGPPSATSATTVGGCTFEELCNGTVISYACDNTVDIRGYSFEQAKQRILKKIGNCIIDLEIARERRVGKVYIGKTHIRQRKAPRGHVPIDPKNPWTYKKAGIGNRWREHRNEDYGKDGMIVLVVITREAVPSSVKQGLHQEGYAFALEQTLLHHFMITNYDPRIANDSFATGGTDVHRSAAYALYMAFKLEDKEDGEGSSLPHTSDNSSDVIFLHEDTDQPPASSTDEDDFPTSSMERRIPQPQAHSTPAQIADRITSKHTQPLEGSPQNEATSQDEVSKIQATQPNSATNIGTVVRFQNPPVSDVYKYQQPTPNRTQATQKLARFTDAATCDAYNFDCHSDSSDEHSSHCLTCNRNAQGKEGSTHSSQTHNTSHTTFASHSTMAQAGPNSASNQSRATTISRVSATNGAFTYPNAEKSSSPTTSTHSTTVYNQNSSTTPLPLYYRASNKTLPQLRTTTNKSHQQTGKGVKNTYELTTESQGTAKASATSEQHEVMPVSTNRQKEAKFPYSSKVNNDNDFERPSKRMQTSRTLEKVPSSTPTSKRQVKRRRCRMCPGCKAKDCGTCKNCLDMPKFGGPAKIRQCCIHRKCINMR